MKSRVYLKPGAGIYALILVFLISALLPAVVGQTQDQSISVSLDREKIEVAQGGQSSYWITLTNNGDELIYVDISFDGEYKFHAWVNDTSVPLLPDMTRQIFMTVYAPVDLVEPGTYTLVISAYAQKYNETTSITLAVEVTGDGSAIDPTWLFILIPVILIPVIVGIATYRIISRMQKTFKVFEIFIVYNDGRLIKHFPVNEDNEEDVSISAMFTAIQEFMSESFEYNEPREEQGYLSEVVFGEIKVYIERGIKFYVALVTKGEPPKDLRKHMGDLREGIEKHFEDELVEWDGDLDPFEKLTDITLDEELEATLERKENNGPADKAK